jgi:hypothetical protein
VHRFLPYRLQGTRQNLTYLKPSLTSRMIDFLNSRIHIRNIVRGTFKYHGHEIRIASVYWNISSSRISPQDHMRSWWKKYKDFLNFKKIHLPLGQLLEIVVPFFLYFSYSLLYTILYNKSIFYNFFFHDFTYNVLLCSCYIIPPIPPTLLPNS